MKIISLSKFCLNTLIVAVRWPLNICRAVFYSIAPIIWSAGCFKGVKTLDFNRSTACNFGQKINEALAIIEHNDQRRFERVRREIRLIVYDRWLIQPLAPGAYFRLAKVCLINFSRFDFSKGPQFETALLAGLIVYLSTHGLLHRKGLRNGKFIGGKVSNVDRIETLCHKEEVRFLLKIGCDLRGLRMPKI